jgi:xanthine dehydrogenase accessory factor
MLLYVLESAGSSPGRQGFFMAVNAAGQMEGSIGGGIMEHKFTEMAKALLKDDEPVCALYKQVHDKRAARNQSGMICSGQQTILLYRLYAQHQPVVQAILHSLHQYAVGTLELSPATGLQFFPGKTPETDFFFTKRPARNWLYREKTGPKNQLFIIGGGHCALALSRIMRTMDFYIRVYDTRPDLSTFLQNEYAHEKITLSDYNTLHHLISDGIQHHYVVVMTLGYRTDDIVVRGLLPKTFKYLGLLGSKTKNSQLLATYAAEGIDPISLARIHSPIGIAIHSQTPEEIAVSIAAQIIQVKNNSLTS